MSTTPFACELPTHHSTQGYRRAELSMPSCPPGSIPKYTTLVPFDSQNTDFAAMPLSFMLDNPKKECIIMAKEQSKADRRCLHEMETVLCVCENKDPDIRKQAQHRGLYVRDFTNPRVVNSVKAQHRTVHQQLGGSTRDRLRQKLAMKKATQ